jgi:hypothetical protein
MIKAMAELRVGNYLMNSSYTMTINSSYFFIFGVLETITLYTITNFYILFAVYMGESQQSQQREVYCEVYSPVCSITLGFNK